jgi:hypothetical protein
MSTKEEKQNQKRKWVRGPKQKNTGKIKKQKKTKLKKALHGKIYNIKN